MNRLDKKSFTPIYYQVGSIIKEDILSGKLPLSSKLPAEEALAKKYGIAKLTLRRALSKLSQEGFVRQVRGKGSFVSGKKPIKRTISILLDRDSAEVSSSSLPKSISGILLYLKEKKCSVRFDHLDELEQLLDERKSGKSDCDGVIALMLYQENLQKLNLLVQAGVPFVSEGFPCPFNWVNLNHILGMEKAFNYLVDLGHTEIGIGSVVKPAFAPDIWTHSRRLLLTFGTKTQEGCLGTNIRIFKAQE